MKYTINVENVSCFRSYLKRSYILLELDYILLYIGLIFFGQQLSDELCHTRVAHAFPHEMKLFHVVYSWKTEFVENKMNSVFFVVPHYLKAYFCSAGPRLVV